MRTVDLIQRKRDGEELAPEEIEYLVVGYTNGDIPDYQMSAFLMAVYFSGMTDREVGRLTECMLRSGETVDMTGVPGIKVDKHSTGGVGDKTSFIVAPLAAAGIPGGRSTSSNPFRAFAPTSAPTNSKSSSANSGWPSSDNPTNWRRPIGNCIRCATLPGRWNRFR